MTISGKFNLDGSGLTAVVRSVLGDDGLTLNRRKLRTANLDGLIAITGICPRRGKMTVPGEFILQVEAQLSAAARFATGGELDGPYYTRSQMAGKVYFVRWIHPGRGQQLLERFRSVDWNLVSARAKAIGLISRRRILLRSNPSGLFTTAAVTPG